MYMALWMGVFLLALFTWLLLTWIAVSLYNREKAGRDSARTLALLHLVCLEGIGLCQPLIAVGYFLGQVYRRPEAHPPAVVRWLAVVAFVIAGVSIVSTLAAVALDPIWKTQWWRGPGSSYWRATKRRQRE